MTATSRLMTATEWMRPARAAAHFGVSRRTLHRWAQAGRIGRSQDGARLTWYVAADIDAVVRHGLTPRAIVPIAPTTTANHDWRDDDFWKGGVR